MSQEPVGRYLCDLVLESLGVAHGFAERGAQPPDSTRFPRQVHGIRTTRAEALDPARPPVEADAIVSRTPGLGAGVVTADCVPILVASTDGACVAAIHAGWRGLAAGVIEAGVEAMAVSADRLRAAVGPAARGCCYEVDRPVAKALSDRYAELLDGVLVPTRPEHFQLDLPALAARVLTHRLGLAADAVGTAASLCTLCAVVAPALVSIDDPHTTSDLVAPPAPRPRFESFRRDGSAAERLRHFIRPSQRRAPQG